MLANNICIAEIRTLTCLTGRIPSVTRPGKPSSWQCRYLDLDPTFRVVPDPDPILQIRPAK